MAATLEVRLCESPDQYMLSAPASQTGTLKSIEPDEPGAIISREVDVSDAVRTTQPVLEPWARPSLPSYSAVAPPALASGTTTTAVP